DAGDRRLLDLADGRRDDHPRPSRRIQACDAEPDLSRACDVHRLGLLRHRVLHRLTCGMMTDGRGFLTAAGRQGATGMSKTEEFEELRPLLFSIAYRILGSVSEAEDAVQETWLRYEASSTRPRSAKAYLSATVTRISIDVLRSARVR